MPFYQSCPIACKKLQFCATEVKDLQSLRSLGVTPV